MRSEILQKIIDTTPKDVEIFIDKYTDLVVRINQVLRQKGYTQKQLAQKLDKKPSEIHKWLSGEHNFTLRSIAKLEAELGVTLLEVLKQAKQTEFVSNIGTITFKVYVNNELPQNKITRWNSAQPNPNFKITSNVG